MRRDRLIISDRREVLWVVTYKQRKQRNFDGVITNDDAVSLLKNNFRNKKLHIKYSIEKREAKINEFLDDNMLMIVTDPDYIPGDDITLYGLLDKYFEIDFKVKEVRGPGYFKCSVESMRKASFGRKDLRFKVSSEKVIATNFKISKHTIDISDFKIPTTIKVIIEQFQSQNAKLGDIVKIDVFQSGNELLDYIKKSGKTLFVEDCANPESYTPLNEDFVDLRDIYGDDLNRVMKRSVERGYKSIITSPVVYITESSQSVPFAYVQVITKKDALSMVNVLEIKELGFNLVDRIRDANTMLISVHQQILDISMGGAKLLITDENLKKYIKHSKGFIFDIVFKLQAPITMYGEIKYTFADDTNNLYVGVDFAGNSSRKDELKRFYSVIKPMEIEYKNKLIKEMKLINEMKQKQKQKSD